MQPPATDVVEEAEKKIVDLKSDLMGPIAPGDSVLFLVGNFAAQHNGAVITCDSAVRYSDMYIEFFGNVLINKNTTYIYGDRAVYDGRINEARVYSDLIKVVDGDATLYTYQFLFNTKDNIGEFADGGVLVNRENMLEAIRGFYFADAKELVAVDEVQMRNDEYELKGDSVVYNMQTDNAFFYERTNIWNKDGDYLYADRGSYNKLDTLYVVTRNGYVLTEKQEMWSDSIHFYRAKDHVILHRDIQIDDTEHKVLAFGDYGEYWKTPGDAILTRRPSVISYDASQGDSLFLRADSLFLRTINTNAERRAADAQAAAARADSLAQVAQAAGQTAGQTETKPSAEPDEPGESTPPSAGSSGNAVTPGSSGGHAGRMQQLADSLMSLRRPSPSDSLSVAELPDSLRPAATDSLNEAAVPVDTVKRSSAEQKALLKAAAQKAKAERKAEAAKVKKAELEEIAAQRKAKNNAKLQAQKEREEKRLQAAKLKAESKLRARQARAARKGKPFVADSTALRHLDSLLGRNAQEQDSLALQPLDSLLADSLSQQIPADSLDSLDSLAMPADSIYRLLKGFHHVKIFRSDFQAVCDSMTAISTDSTIHLYIDPVLWNQSNQITSDVMDIYTLNQQVTHAKFVGSPMMISELDTTHYNQVAGKEMTAYFRNNEIYRNDVNGNAQTIYYMQDGEPPVVTGMGVIESGDCSYYIEDKQVINIVYRKEPTWNIYPLDKIPEDQTLRLKGFKWEGARRPTQTEVFDRQIRPSEREQRLRLRHPQFPIQRRIDDYKQRLILERRWYDRNELVDDETTEWMRSLGYEVGKPRK